jgi:pyruvate/2-oxoglutarate dehydrogenase complex dihydrolipoamide acyltransferase (E2) component
MPREVIMPALGMAQKAGLIVAWLKRPGEAVKTGDALMEVETDKAVMEVEAQADGFLTDVRAAAGDAVPVGQVVAVISDSPAGSGSASTPPANAKPTENDPPSLVAGKPVVEAPTDHDRFVAERFAQAGEDAPDAPKPPPPGERRAPKPVAQPERGTTSPRVLASPKARRLAAEQGLDLSRLVAAGFPQPYHVSDLEALRALPAALAVSAPETTQASRHLTARVRGDRFAGFLEWMRAETGAFPDATSVMAGMAAAALRQDASDKPLTVAVEAFGRKRLFADPDRCGLGLAKTAEPSAPPALILRDLRGTGVATLRIGAEAAPALSVSREGPDMLITLECAPGQLQPKAAVELISGFAGRLAEPLRHLL